MAAAAGRARGATNALATAAMEAKCSAARNFLRQSWNDAHLIFESLLSTNVSSNQFALLWQSVVLNLAFVLQVQVQVQVQVQAQAQAQVQAQTLS